MALKSVVSKVASIRSKLLTNHQSGMSLLEVMMAGVVATTIGLGVAQLVSNMNKGAVSVQRKDDFIELQKVISMAGQTQANCNTLIGATVSGNTLTVNSAQATQTLTQITIPNGASTITLASSGATNRTYGSGIYITGLTLSVPGQSLGGSNYLGSLNITADRYDTSSTTKRAAQVPGPSLTAQIPITFVDSDGDGKANSCVVGSTSGSTGQSELIVAQVGPADCVGSTGTAIQQCVNLAAASSPARGVLIKAGTYTSSQILVASSITIRGEPGTIVQAPSVMGAGVFYTTATLSDIVIKDLTIDLTPNTSAFKPGIDFEGSTSRATIQNIIFTQTNSGRLSQGVWLRCGGASDCLDNRIIGNYFGTSTSAFYGRSILLSGVATNRFYNTRINENYVNSTYPIAIGASPTAQFTNLFVRDNIIDIPANTSGGISFTVDGNYVSRNLHFTGNTITAPSTVTGSSKFGISISHNGTGGGNVSYLDSVFISDNIINLNDAGIGISLTGNNTTPSSANHFRIENNWVYTGGNSSALYVYGIGLNLSNIRNNYMWGYNYTSASEGATSGINFLGAGAVGIVWIENNEIAYFRTAISFANTGTTVRVYINDNQTYVNTLSGHMISMTGATFSEFTISRNHFNIWATTGNYAAIYTNQTSGGVTITDNETNGMALLYNYNTAANGSQYNISNNIIGLWGGTTIPAIYFVQQYYQANIQGNYIYGAGNGIYAISLNSQATGFGDADIVNNYINNTTSGIFVNAGEYNQHSVKVIGNFIYANTVYGIYLNTNGTLVKDNFLNTASALSGVVIGSGYGTPVVSGNMISGYTTGIQGLGGVEVVSGNRVVCRASTAGTIGILTSSYSTAVTGNMVYYCAEGIDTTNGLYTNISGNSIGSPGNLGWSVGIFGKESIITGNHISGHVYGIVQTSGVPSAAAATGGVVSGNWVANRDWNTGTTGGTGILLYGPSDFSVTGNSIDGGSSTRRYAYGINAVTGSGGAIGKVVATGNSIKNINLGTASSTYTGNAGRYAIGYTTRAHVGSSFASEPMRQSAGSSTTLRTVLNNHAFYWGAYITGGSGVDGAYVYFPAFGVPNNNTIVSYIYCDYIDNTAAGDLIMYFNGDSNGCSVYSTGAAAGWRSASSNCEVSFSGYTEPYFFVNYGIDNAGANLELLACYVDYTQW